MALYHKYRPQRFDEIIGQEHIVTTLTNQIRLGKVAHAYLFFGPRGVGKTTVARLLAKAVNCPKAPGSTFEPDNTTTAAKEISESRSLDIIEIDAASHTGVDHVREQIIETAQFRPTSLPYKVFIIDEVHMLSTSAFNALLKILEEPPKHVIFILATTELHKLPETIVSRCQRFTFHKLSYTVLSNHIQSVAEKEGVTLEPSVIDRLVKKSEGGGRDAISLLDQLLAGGETHITDEIASLVLPCSQTEETLAFLTHLILKQGPECLHDLRQAEEKGISLPLFIEDCLAFLRVMMIYAMSGSFDAVTDTVSDEAKDAIGTLSQSIDAASIITLIGLLQKRYRDMSSSIIPSLPIEMAIVTWCYVKETSPQHRETTIAPTPRTPSPKISTPTAPTPTIPPPASIVHETQKEEPKPIASTKKEPLPSIVQEIAQEQNSSTPLCSFEDAKRYWEGCLKMIEQDSPSLIFILRMTQVVSLVHSTLLLHVQYGFHKDKLLDISTKKKIETFLYEQSQRLLR